MSGARKRDGVEVWDRFWATRAVAEDVYPPVSDIAAELRAAVGDPDGKIGLEVGAGTGQTARELVTSGARVVCLDYSREAIRLVRTSGGTPVLADALHCPFRDGAFSFVYHQGLLEHFRDPNPLLAENARVVATGGALLVDVPQRFNLYTLLKHALMLVGAWFAGWETEFSPRALEALVEAHGFRTVHRYGYNMHPGLVYRVVRLLAARVGLRLPLFPRFLAPLWRAARAFERLRWAHWLTLTVGVVGVKER